MKYELSIYTVNEIDEVTGEELGNPKIKLVDVFASNNRKRCEQVMKELVNKYTKDDDIEVLFTTNNPDKKDVKCYQFLQQEV